MFTWGNSFLTYDYALVLSICRFYTNAILNEELCLCEPPTPSPPQHFFHAAIWKWTRYNARGACLCSYRKLSRCRSTEFQELEAIITNAKAKFRVRGSLLTCNILHTRRGLNVFAASNVMGICGRLLSLYRREEPPVDKRGKACLANGELYTIIYSPHLRVRVRML